MTRFAKVHLHSEQFDGWLHAECGAGDVAPPSRWIVGEDEFDEMPEDRLCAKCFRYAYPYGFRDDRENGASGVLTQPPAPPAHGQADAKLSNGGDQGSPIVSDFEASSRQKGHA